MKFGEKLREQRKKSKLTKERVAKVIDVSSRTITNYEKGTSHPKDRSVYFKLAEFFGVDVNYFLTENEEFLTVAAENFGKRGQAQAAVILEQAAALFAGGELSETDQIAFLRDMQGLFLESKQMAQEKFTPKRFRNDSLEQTKGKGQGQ